MHKPMSRENALATIESAVLWERVGERFRSRNVMNFATDFTLDDLALVHHLLPPLMKYLFKNGDDGNGYQVDICIKRSLTYWPQPGAVSVVRDDQGIEHTVSRILEIDALPGEGHAVFEAICLDKGTFPVMDLTGTIVNEVFIGGAYRDSFCVPSVWLNEKYPGWAERMLAVQAMGMEPEEQVSHILHAALPVHAVPMDGLGFD